MDVVAAKPFSRRALPIKQLPRLPNQATAEQRYWNTFKVWINSYFKFGSVSDRL